MGAAEIASMKECRVATSRANNVVTVVRSRLVMVALESAREEVGLLILAEDVNFRKYVALLVVYPRIAPPVKYCVIQAASDLLVFYDVQPADFRLNVLRDSEYISFRSIGSLQTL
jgi:hypothetical protein